MKKLGLQTLIGCSFLLIFTISAFAHCEIPCGIYDDNMRIDMINEHIATIEKSINQINQLSKESPINYNQLVRWITTKETHADEIQNITAQYFMTQRIKPDMKQYSAKLEKLHQILIYSMKCKQTTDLANTEKLKTLVKDFAELYFKAE